MKKLFILILGLLTLNVYAANDRPVTYKELPQKAQQFITKHFSNVKFSSAKVDGREYEVYLSDGTQIDFNAAGEWKDVDCHARAVPASIVPEAIAKNVKANYPKSVFIVKIEKTRNGYDVELNNDIDLKYDAKGKLLRTEHDD